MKKFSPILGMILLLSFFSQVYAGEIQGNDPLLPQFDIPMTSISSSIGVSGAIAAGLPYSLQGMTQALRGYNETVPVTVTTQTVITQTVQVPNFVTVPVYSGTVTTTTATTTPRYFYIPVVTWPTTGAPDYSNSFTSTSSYQIDTATITQNIPSIQTATTSQYESYYISPLNGSKVSVFPSSPSTETSNTYGSSSFFMGNIHTLDIASESIAYAIPCSKLTPTTCYPVSNYPAFSVNGSSSGSGSAIFGDSGHKTSVAGFIPQMSVNSYLNNGLSLGNCGVSGQICGATTTPVLGTPVTTTTTSGTPSVSGSTVVQDGTKSQTIQTTKTTTTSGEKTYFVPLGTSSSPTGVIQTVRTARISELPTPYGTPTQAVPVYATTPGGKNRITSVAKTNQVTVLQSPSSPGSAGTLVTLNNLSSPISLAGSLLIGMLLPPHARAVWFGTSIKTRAEMHNQILTNSTRLPLHSQSDSSRISENGFQSTVLLSNGFRIRSSFPPLVA